MKWFFSCIDAKSRKSEVVDGAADREQDIVAFETVSDELEPRQDRDGARDGPEEPREEAAVLDGRVQDGLLSERFASNA